MVVRVDVFAVRAASEIHLLHERVAGINLVPLARSQLLLPVAGLG
jgi:hypothetical protein